MRGGIQQVQLPNALVQTVQTFRPPVSLYRGNVGHEKLHFTTTTKSCNNNDETFVFTWTFFISMFHFLTITYYYVRVFYIPVVRIFGSNAESAFRYFFASFILLKSEFIYIDTLGFRLLLLFQYFFLLYPCRTGIIS